MTFFKTAIYICFILLIFTLLLNFIDSTGGFNTDLDVGTDIGSEDDVLNQLTGLDSGMSTVWAVAVGAGGLIAVGLSFLTHSIVPVGIHLFSTVFWTSYTRLLSVVSGISVFNDIEGFVLIFSVCVVFLFIAAVVGILTGSG